MCDADVLEVLVDGAQYLTVPYGGDRLDTLKQSAETATTDLEYCYSMWPTSDLASTPATLFADGQEIDKATFNVTRLSTGEFAEGPNEVCSR